jgi:hypothetical protein
MDPMKWVAERLWGAQREQFIRDGMRRRVPPDPAGQRVRVVAGAVAMVVAAVVWVTRNLCK